MVPASKTRSELPIGPSTVPFVGDATVADGAVEWRAGLFAWYGLLVLIAATVLAAVDRQILVLLAEPMRQSLGLSDTKLGLLQGAGIALFAGATAVPLGWLADRYGRRAVLAACVLVWTAATAACGLAWDFQSLFVAAIGLGIGEAGLAPIIYGLIPDIVAPKKRVLANGIYAVAAIFGAGLGIGLSGAMVEVIQTLRHLLPPAISELEPWRLSFFAVALPGPVIAVMILLIRLRKHAASDAAARATSPLRLADYLRAHGRTLLGVFGSTGLGGLGIAALAAWVPVIATRNFGGTPQQVGQGIGAAYLIGTVCGALIGGYGVRKLRPVVGVATPVRVLAIGLGLSAVSSAALFAATTAWQVYVLFGLQVAFLISGTVLAPTLLQDMTPAALRSRILALGSVVTILLSALSPILVGLMSDALQAGPRSLLIATTIVASVSLALGAVLTKGVEGRFVGTVKAVAAQAELDDDVPPAPTPVIHPVTHPDIHPATRDKNA